MDFVRIDKKWNEKWKQDGLYKFDKKNTSNKHYVLEMFSYPSGAKLHVGHWWNYGLTDIYARYMHARGKNVFHPMGFDAFGLPAENYAIKTGIHPQDSTLENIRIMEEQLRNMGASFDWDYEIATCLPDYYKWTQWLFLQLYKKGLAYRKKAPVNWCPSCNTVLANEQVQDNKCERCSSEVTRKDLTQWFFKITHYAEELLQGLDRLDWPEKTKLMQRYWIGKSKGAELVFNTESGDAFSVFTTRADTLFGCSYCVLAPEHPLVDKLTTAQYKHAVEQYKEQAKKATEIERLSTSKEKTGVFTGSYAINPINKQRVQIWIGDYVLATYGTGAIMGVPAHDERDYKFAQKHDLAIKRVIRSADGSNDDLPYCEYGIMCNSGEFDGLKSAEGAVEVARELSKYSLGKEVTNYRLRDWLVSRQRYWGAPIPIIYCEHCGVVPVPEEQLPVKLPYDVDFAPDGASPLAKCAEFLNTTCPICGAKAKREADTLDTFVCSSWYYLRYPDNKNGDMPFEPQYINRMLPVDKYVGGPEHACGHLLYSRFITKALRDMGYLNFDEPFQSLVHQGIILGPDGNRMSKSHGNVISPDDYIKEYGSDIFRSYMAFGFKYTEGGPWNDDGIKAIARWFDRVERVVENAIALRGNRGSNALDADLKYARANTIKCVGADYAEFSFNTAVARMMELVNTLVKYQGEKTMDGELQYQVVLDLIRVLAPLAPHIAEEFWQMLGQPYSVYNQSFPVYCEADLVKSKIEIAVQINSKIKGRILIDAGLDSKEIEKVCLQSAEVLAVLDGAIPKKTIVIANRLINFIV